MEIGWSQRSHGRDHCQRTRLKLQLSSWITPSMLTLLALRETSKWTSHGRPPSLIGTFQLHRILTAKVANKVIEFAVKGDASFTKGVFSAGSPIKTDIDLKYLIEGRDLIGKASKSFNGKEYSIEFPEGSMVMPKISMGA